MILHLCSDRQPNEAAWDRDRGTSQVECFEQGFVILARVQRGKTQRIFTGPEKSTLLRRTTLLANHPPESRQRLTADVVAHVFTKTRNYRIDGIETAR